MRRGSWGAESLEGWVGRVSRLRLFLGLFFKGFRTDLELSWEFGGNLVGIWWEFGGNLKEEMREVDWVGEIEKKKEQPRRDAL